MRGKNQPPGYIAALWLLTGSLFAASFGAKVQAATAWNPGQDNVVISEFRSRGPTAGFEVFDDFVEIFNPSGHNIDISGWYIKSVSNSGTTRTQYQFAGGTLLAPGQHYLITGNYYSGTVPGDGKFATSGIADNGGVELTDPDGTVIDLAGVSPLSAEGTPLAPLLDNLDQSYERMPGGAEGSCFDSDDNSADFILRAPSDPQNFTDASLLTVCMAATETPPPTSTPTGTPTDIYTATETDTPTNPDTPAGTPTHTGTPTITPTPSDTGTSTKTPTFTHTPVPSKTLPATSTASSTKTEKPTRTLTYTRSPSSSKTQTFTRTPSLTKTETITRLSSLTKTSRTSRTVTFTHTPRDTHTPSLTRTITSTCAATSTRNTSTRTRTITPRPGIMLINEVLPYPQSDWNEDGKIDTGDEFIELINVGAANINIKNWTLDTGEGTQAFPLPNMDVLPRQILVFFHSEAGLRLSASGGRVRLLKPDSSIVDIYKYPAAQAPDKTWCRMENGGSGLQATCRPSPGRPNVPYEPLPAGSNSLGICSLADLVPLALAQPECNGPGGRIWNEPVGIQVRMNKQWKWDVFLE